RPAPRTKGDAFDPSAVPRAPGAPLPLGATPPSAPLASTGNPVVDEQIQFGSGPMPLRPTAAAAAPQPSVAATSAGDPRFEYESAYAFLTQRRYEEAEMGFRRFLQSNPRDRLAPEASFWLGETYLQRSRFREAAEQFLLIST